MIQITDLHPLTHLKLFGDDKIYKVDCEIYPDMTYIGISDVNDISNRKKITIDEIECLVY